MATDNEWSQYDITDVKPKENIDWNEFDVTESKPKSSKSKRSESTGIAGVEDDIMDLFSNAITGALDLPDKVGQSAKYMKENPISGTLHNARQIQAGEGDLAKSLVNSGADVSDYLLKKQLHPAQLFTPNEGEEVEDKIKSEEDLAKSLGKNFGSSFHGQLANQLINAISKNFPKLPEDTGVEKLLGLEPKKESGDELFRQLPNALALGAGAVAGGKGLYQAGKKVNNLINKPAVQLTEAQHAENALKKSLQEARNATGEAQLKAANDLSEQKNNLLESHAEKASEAESLIPNEPESVIKNQTVNHFTQVRDQLKSHFDNQYNDFSNTVGRTPVSSPLTSEELDPALRVLNPAGRQMGEGLVPQQVNLSIIDPETGRPYVLNIPAANGSVQDYIEMMRTARDARSKLKRDMNKPSVTRADELQMANEAHSLKTLQDSVTDKIKNSISPEEWEQFQEIQRDYKDLYRPFMDNKHLFDAWFNKKDSGQIFKELNQPAYSRLFNSLHDDPAFNQLALTHALRGKIHPLNESNPVTQSKKINELLAPHNADINRFMSPEQFATLKSLSTYGNLIGDADKSLQSLSKSLLSKATKALEISKATKLNPQAEALLNEVSTKQLSQKEINKRMKDAGIHTEEAKANFESRKNANQLLKKALSFTSLNSILNKF